MSFFLELSAQQYLYKDTTSKDLLAKTPAKESFRSNIYQDLCNKNSPSQVFST